MKPDYKKLRIYENIELCSGIYKMVLEKEESMDINPGQFYMLKAEVMEPLLGRPISLCSYDEDRLEFIYQVYGKGTEIFSRLKSGDYINVLGPLGNGFDLREAVGNIAIVSGGIGIAPMKGLAKFINKAGLHSSVDLYSGFRDEIYLIDDIEPYVNKVSISTDTGSRGHKGFVTDIFDPSKYDVVFCCGPELMMKNVVEMCKSKAVKVYVSTEKHMACGVGACLVCTCKTKFGNKRSCKDGPVFLGEHIVL